MASEASTPTEQTSGSGIARRTWDWVRGKKSSSEQETPNNSVAEKRQKQRIKSKSADIPTVGSESEKENQSPAEQRPSSPFTALAWDNSMSNRERVQAPTHTDDKISSDGKSEQEEKKRAKRLSCQPKGTIVYTVSGNETLASVAARFDTTITELKKLNKLMTTMIWPGQTLYVRDKDYVPSPPPSPVTPSPKSPSSPTTEFPRQAPGLAVAVETSAQDSTGHPPLAKRPSTEERLQSVEEVLTERFVKVTVKHITDGQGVVGGVLLVTPNAVMFDPNVSDPLVLEHGAERYGLMAPMDTILSVAMYHDIAAMKLKTNPQDAATKKSKVYHSEDCPLAKDSVTMETDNGSTPDLIRDIPSTSDNRSRTQSVCSCGHDDTGKSATLPSNEKKSAVLDACNGKDVGKDEPLNNKDKNSICEDKDTEGVEKSTDVSATSEQEVSDATEAPPTAGASANSSQISSGLNIEPSDSQGSRQFKKLPAISEPEEEMSSAKPETEVDDEKSEKVLFSLSLEETSYMDSVPRDKDSDTNSNTITTNDGCQATATNQEATSDNAVSTNNASSLDTGNVMDRGENTVARGNGQNAKDGTPLVTALAQDAQATQDSSKGLISRTLGSLSSISSFSSPPGFSSLVDYSSGLFARKDSKVKDIHEVDMNAPPESRNSSGIFYVNVQNSASDSVDKVQVESAVSLDDRPELFQSLDALIPRPAAQYEDPPLYLCLRLRHAKLQGKVTSPIESYSKGTFKPEYWFSIPKEKVDQLYAFFIQWSPNLYDNEEEVDAESQGFVVVEQDNIDIVDDHFNPGRRLSQSWKMVHAEEVIQNTMPTLEDLVVLPELLEPSNILLNDHIIQLGENLPARAEGYPWTLKYSSAKHGISLKTLYRSMKGIESPVLLVVKDTNNQVFGAMLSCGPKVSDHFYGSGETYLYTFYPEFKTFRWTGTNNFYIKGNQESLAIGASEGTYGLWLDSDIYHGRTHFCSTFNNDVLTESEDFVISAVEAWTFV